jgi:hypothetical protein
MGQIGAPHCLRPSNAIFPAKDPHLETAGVAAPARLLGSGAAGWARVPALGPQQPIDIGLVVTDVLGRWVAWRASVRCTASNMARELGRGEPCLEPLLRRRGDRCSATKGVLPPLRRLEPWPHRRRLSPRERSSSPSPREFSLTGHAPGTRRSTTTRSRARSRGDAPVPADLRRLREAGANFLMATTRNSGVMCPGTATVV